MVSLMVIHFTLLTLYQESPMFQTLGVLRKPCKDWTSDCIKFSVWWGDGYTNRVIKAILEKKMCV